MINKEGLTKMLRDLRVLDFLKIAFQFSINDNMLYVENYNNPNEKYEILTRDIPDYIKDDLLDWVADYEI